MPDTKQSKPEGFGGQEVKRGRWCEFGQQVGNPLRGIAQAALERDCKHDE